MSTNNDYAKRAENWLARFRYLVSRARLISLVCALTIVLPGAVLTQESEKLQGHGVAFNAYGVRFERAGICSVISETGSRDPGSIPAGCSWQETKNGIALTQRYLLHSTFIARGYDNRDELSFQPFGESFSLETPPVKTKTGTYRKRDASGAVLDWIILETGGRCQWQNYATCTWNQTSNAIIEFKLSTVEKFTWKNEGAKTILSSPEKEMDFEVGEPMKPWTPQTEPNRLMIARGAGKTISLAVSPDGSVIASNHEYDQGIVYLWNKKGELIRTMVGTWPAQRLEFSADGKLLLIASAMPQIRDVETGKIVFEFPPGVSVSDAIWMENGEILSVDEDGRAQLRDLKGQILQNKMLEGHFLRASLSTRGILLISQKGATLFNAKDFGVSARFPLPAGIYSFQCGVQSPDGRSVILTDAGDMFVYRVGKLFRKLKYDGHQTCAFNFSRDSKSFVFGGYATLNLLPLADDKADVKVLDLADVAGNSNYSPTAIVPTPDGKVISGHTEGTVRVFSWP